MTKAEIQTLQDAASWTLRAWRDHPDCPGALATAQALQRMIDEELGRRWPYVSDFSRRGLLAAHKATNDEHSFGL